VNAVNAVNLDVVIIGAGIHGAGAAYHLARAGVRVAVLGRLTPAAAGSPQRNSMHHRYGVGKESPKWPSHSIGSCSGRHI
jgi:glycine/D-amino acid oxidase-like deaminating enzyme